MKTIYVDNFRGFDSTYIPIKNVNFLVGENSTGKTSLLSLIKLINTLQFWFNLNFDYEEIKLGHFNDIVSINSSDRSYFSIGVIDTKKEKKEEFIQAYLMKFKNDEGRPIISKFSFNRYNKSYTLKFTPKKVQYLKDNIINYKDEETFIKNIFTNWIKTHKEEKIEFKTLKGIPNGRNRGLLAIMSIVEEQKESKFNFEKYISELPDFDRILWIAPIRTKPKRTYDEYRTSFSSEGEHTPYLIKKFLSRKKYRDKFLNFLNKVGKSSGLFETVTIRNYGKGLTDPFELDIVLSIYPISIEFVGYGVSQSLPLIVDFIAAPEDSCFLVQQPEVHLHPKAQATIGEAIYQLALSENKKFFIETHSDYLIDRFRITKSNNQKDNLESQILYFERDKKGNHLYQINILKNGKLPSDQPKGYRRFFIKEQIELMGI